jgi:zinc transport system ATP-binding protein
MIVLKVSRLSVIIGKNEILKDISFELNEGEILIIVGPNGAGKTTLLKSILKMVPYKGEIYLKDGYKIGYLPQNFQSSSNLPITTYEVLNISTHKKKNEIIEIMKKFEIYDYKDELFKNLSGGLKQRTLIARSILNGNKILILDEPTNNLDLKAQSEFYEFIKRLRDEHQVSIILVSHDVGIISTIADNVICLNRTIFYHGKPDKNFNLELIRKLYNQEVYFLLHAHR